MTNQDSVFDHHFIANRHSLRIRAGIGFFSVALMAFGAVLGGNHFLTSSMLDKMNVAGEWKRANYLRMVIVLATMGAFLKTYRIAGRKSNSDQ